MISHKAKRKDFVIVFLCRFLEESQHAQKVVFFDKAQLFSGGALGDMRNDITLCQLFPRTKKTIDLAFGNQIDWVQ